MGFMRLLLATAVFITHQGPLFGLTLVPGNLAVQAFFLISGFYMAFILETKYKADTKTFLINRFSKIYFTYFVVLAGSILAMVIFKNTFYSPNELVVEYLSKSSLGTVVLLFFSNLAILGLDVLMFFKIQPSGHLCSILACQGGVAPNLFMLIPQAWSLSMELVFYLMAPSLVRLTTAKLFTIVSFIVGVRFLLWCNYLFIEDDPWSYRFFPFELATFLMGMLAYRFYNHPVFARWAKYRWGFAAAPFAMIAGYASLTFPLKTPLFILLFWLCLPFLFSATKSFKWDRLVGELSYPVYVCHLLVIQVAQNTLVVDPSSAGQIFVLILIVSALLLALERPVERWRQKNISGPAPVLRDAPA